MLKPNDEYRDAVEVLELALDLRDGAKLSKTPSPQKLDNARKIRESLAGLQPPNLNGESVLCVRKYCIGSNGVQGAKS